MRTKVITLTYPIPIQKGDHPRPPFSVLDKGIIRNENAIAFS